ncbi:MAG: hydantoinase/oxoprolinase family protein [Ardenticatenaceae bacterium]|nr:hydantoinase/oxoprolinase family protein [Ardenticatenaceae bacterium]MCB9442902.1 hydantoinase/oxoprolinase family protein [Ardenticatenaceae bacterium]
MNELVLGIDTGGTYTDGVLLERNGRHVVATAKTLTTRQDLRWGILQVLDELLPDEPERVKLVAISTTLATNAIAEGKGRPVALFLLGYDPDLVRRFSFEGQFATPRFEYFQGGHDLYGKAQAPLDVAGIVARAKALQDEVEAIAVSGYFSPFNASHEEQAYQAITEATDLPVVLGYQLSSHLNSVQRATTAALNASLLSILQAFMAAMHRALDERHITAPLMVLRGDGTLMNTALAQQRPVETVHSGPAASAIGGRFLAGLDKSLVIDIGGTTTDIAVIDGGRVAVSEQGTAVGPYQTAIRGAHIHSLGLGGDSKLGFDVEDQLTIGPERVVPIAYLAQQHPVVYEELKQVNHRLQKRPSPDLIEFWFLQREPRRFLANGRARAVIEMLRERPYPLPTILERLGLLHPLQVDGRSLIDQEIIGRAALTPTDLLHLSGEYAPWHKDAARLAAVAIARLRGWTVEQLQAQTHRQIVETITAAVITYLSGQTLTRSKLYSVRDDLGAWLFQEHLTGTHPYLGSKISLKIPLVGIGAPAAIYLPDVAQLLGTELILPPHYQVANAVGAVAGSVMVSREAWIYPLLQGTHVRGFYAQIGPERHRFAHLDEALDYARQTISQQALDAARQAGAVDPHLEICQLPDGAESYRLRASAIGNPDLSSKYVV